MKVSFHFNVNKKLYRYILDVCCEWRVQARLVSAVAVTAWRGAVLCNAADRGRCRTATCVHVPLQAVPLPSHTLTTNFLPTFLLYSTTKSPVFTVH